MACEFVPPIEPAGLGKPFHAQNQVGFGSFDDPMKIISHQAPSVNRPVGFGAGFGEGRQKAPPIQVVVVNRLAPVPAIHDMVNRPGLWQSEFARHAPSLSAGGESVKPFLQ